MLSLRTNNKENLKKTYLFNDFILTIKKIVMPFENRQGSSTIGEEYRLIKSACLFIIDWLLEKAGIMSIEISQHLEFIALFSAKQLQDDNSILFIFDDKKSEINALVTFLEKHYPDFAPQLIPIHTLPFINADAGSRYKVRDRDNDFVAAHAMFPAFALKDQICKFDSHCDYRTYIEKTIKVLKIKIAPIFKNHLITYLGEYAKRCFAITTKTAENKLRAIYPEIYNPILFQKLIFYIIKDKIQKAQITSNKLKSLSNDVLIIINDYLAQNVIFRNANAEITIPTYFTEHGKYAYKLQARENYDSTLTAIKNYFNAILPQSAREYENAILIDAAALAHPCFHLDIQETFEQHPNLLPHFIEIKNFEIMMHSLEYIRGSLYGQTIPPDIFFCDPDPTQLNPKIVTVLTELIDKFLKNVYENGARKIAELSEIRKASEKITKDGDGTSHNNVISSLFHSKPKMYLEYLKNNLVGATTRFWRIHSKITSPLPISLKK